MKRLAGTVRKDRLKNEPTPAALARTPQPPKTLPAEGRKLWRRLAPSLRQMGVLTEVDVPSFETLCFWWGFYQDAIETLRREGLLSEGASGQPVRHPAADLANVAWRNFIKAAIEFGLTPSARCRIDLPTAIGEEAENPLAEFLTADTDSEPVGAN